MTRARTLAVFCLFLLVLAPAVRAGTRGTLVLLNNLNPRTEAETFSCRETIYADVVWAPVPVENGTLRVEWRSPTGETVKSVSVPVSAQARDTWVSLRLADTGGFARLFGTAEDYAGRWTVVVYLNGERLGERTFDIGC